MKKNIQLFLMCFFVIVLINSCKTDKQTDTSTTQISTETTVSVRLRAEPDGLNPLLTTRGWSLEVCAQLFPTLLDHDPFTLKLSPNLVKSRPVVKVVENGERKGWTTYTYELLDEATWDDGSPVTANDYVFSLKALFNPHVAAAPYRGYLALIRDVELDPDNAKKFTVFTDRKYIIAEFATGLFIYPKYKYDPENILDAYNLIDLTNPDLAEQHKADETLMKFGESFNSDKYKRDPEWVSGCGPYKLQEWIEGERVVLVKKENWWGDQLREQYPMLTAYPKQITYKFLADAATAITMMKGGDLDVAGKIPEEQFNEFKESEIGQENFTFHTPPLFGYSYFGLNTRSPKLNDKRVRRAIAHLVDIDEILKTVKLGYAEPIIGPFHPTRSYYNDALAPIKLNIEKAKTLLSEAGWEDSNGNGTVDKEIDGALVEMELDLMITPNNKPSSSMGLIFQNEAKKAGVAINIVEKEANTFRGQLRSRDFEIFAGGTASDISLDDPKQYWHTESDTPSGGNRYGFGNAESDKLIEEIRSELDQTKRDALYKKLQEIIYEEQPAIFLYTTKDRIAIHNRYQDVRTSIKKYGYFVNYFYE